MDARPAQQRRVNLRPLPLAAACALALAALTPAAQAQFYLYTPASVSTGPVNLIPFNFLLAEQNFGSNSLYVGNSSPDSSFAALAGAQLSVGGLTVAPHAAGVASFSVTGAAGTPTLVSLTGTQNRLEVGNWGVGTMTVAGGALVDGRANEAACLAANVSCGSFIANAAGSNALLTITGAGSEVRTLGFFGVGGGAVFSPVNGNGGFGTPGAASTARIELLAGGTLRTDGANISMGPGGANPTGTEHSSASVLIDGTGSRWIVTPDRLHGGPANVNVASHANASATLAIRNGGQMLVDGNGATPREATLTLGNRGQADMTISGSGSELRLQGLNGNLVVGTGDGGRGSLVVDDQALVRAGGLLVGAGRTASGAVAVRGGRIELDNGINGLLVIGNSGNGSLAVSDGGLVDATLNPAACPGNWCGSIVGFGAGSNGLLSITGAGSEVRSMRALQVADAWVDPYNGIAGATATGRIEIGAGGVLRSQGTTLGGSGFNGPNANGAERSFASAVVDGNGSLWSLTPNSVDGPSGAWFAMASAAGSQATLTLRNGGRLLVDGSAGPGQYDNLQIGSNGGRADVLIEGGGRMNLVGAAAATAEAPRSGTLSIGAYSPSANAGTRATVVVRGAGSELTTSGANMAISVGEQGASGRLEVRDFGFVSSSGGLNLGLKGGVGEMLVDNGEVQITGANGRLLIGSSGEGSLRVTGGSLVNAAANPSSCIGGWCGNIVANGAGSTGTLVVSGTSSEVHLLRNFTAGSAYVDNFTGTPGGSANATIQVLAGGLLATQGYNALGTGPAGSAALGTERSFVDVLVDGVNSKWLISPNAVEAGNAQLAVGTHARGSATVRVSNGGQIIVDGTGGPGGNDGFNIGSSGPGTVTVAGAGSAIIARSTANPYLNVGANNSSGNGSLSLLDGGTATTLYGNVGRNGGSGTLLVSGAGSRYIGTGTGVGAGNGPAFLSIGRNGGTGTVTVSNGGRISLSDGGGDGRLTGNSTGFIVGREANGVGSMLITGAGSLVEVSSTALNPPAGTSDNTNPSVGIGRDSASASGQLTVANGGQLLLTGNAASTSANPRTTSLSIGGHSDSLAGGTGSVLVSGAGSVIRLSGSDAFISVGRSGVGSLTVANGGLVAGTIMNVGRSTGGVGNLAVSAGTIEMTGQYTSAASGASLSIGNRGGTGAASLSSGSLLSIVNTGTAGATLGIGGTGPNPLGHGTLSVSGGSQIVLQANPGQGTVTIGRDGSGVVSLSGASSISAAGNEVVLARLAGSFGQLSMAGNSALSAAYVGVGSQQGGIDGGLARLIVNASTLTATTLEIGTQGYLGGTGGTINANVINRGTISPGNSPGDLVINGSLQNVAGGHILLEVESDGNGGFVTDRLIFGAGTPDFSAVQFSFAFLGSTNPSEFIASGGFQLDTFLRAGNSAATSQPLSTTFAAGTDWSQRITTQQFSVISASYQVTGLNISASGAVSGTVTAVPEPAPAALLLAGLGAVGWLARRRHRTPR